ncbi:hypothetical protein ASE21_13745 [Flavobacterium sp. Root901]|uniref:hypothetical protein n=1 Tax=Flavobacterium sp. Root901 TaxID=1736605 RepID=UPI00070AC6DC|nr:hypothetical protein [Flavobacterium sp. Root901]KRD08912.1 hypothetical protein ASE21_13745 [Flavobacterium sp. Root901]
MRKILCFAIFLLFISCTNKAETPKGNSFSLKEVDIAIIYSKKLNNFPCLLYNATDTIKKHEEIGIVFKFDVKYNPQNNSSNCGCVIEPGLGGTNDSIKSLKILFKKGKTEMDVTKILFNKEESILLNPFEKFDKRLFDKNDFSCICFDEKKKEYIEYLNKNYLGGRVFRKVNPKNVPIFKNPDEFVTWFNNIDNQEFEVGFSNKNITSGNKFLITNFSFWFPNGFFKVLKNYNEIKIEVELDNGLILEKSRILKMV